MSSNQFERKLRERFREAEIPPRPEVWEQVEARIRPDGNRPDLLWLWWDGLMILVFLLLFIWPGISERGFSGMQQAEIARTSVLPPEPGDVSGESTEDFLASQTPVIELNKNRLAHEVEIPDADESHSASTGESLESTWVQSTSPSPNSIGHIQHESPTAEVQSVSIQMDTQIAGASANGQTFQSKQAPSTDLYSAQEARSGIIDQPKSLVNLPVRASAPVSGSLPNLQGIDVISEVEFMGPDMKPELEPIPWEMMPHRRWAFRAYVRPEMAFTFSEGATRENAALASPGPTSLFLESRATDNNFVYGNYQPPNEDTYYLVAHPRSSLTVGFEAEYFLSRKLSVQSGLSYTRSEQGQFQEGVIALSTGGPQAPTDSGFTAGLDELSVSANSNFRNIEIAVPIQLNYYIARGRSSWILAGGMSLRQQYAKGSFQSGASMDFQTPGPGTGNNSNTGNQVGAFTTRNLEAYVHVKALYERSLTERIGIYAGPMLQYRLTNGATGTIPGNSPLPYRYGVEMGLRIRTGK